MTIPFVSGGLSHLSMKESFVENKGHFWRKIISICLLLTDSKLVFVQFDENVLFLVLHFSVSFLDVMNLGFLNISGTFLCVSFLICPRRL